MGTKWNLYTKQYWGKEKIVSKYNYKQVAIILWCQIGHEFTSDYTSPQHLLLGSAARSRGLRSLRSLRGCRGCGGSYVGKLWGMVIHPIAGILKLVILCNSMTSIN